MSVTIFGIGISGVVIAHTLKLAWNEIKNIGKGMNKEKNKNNQRLHKNNSSNQEVESYVGNSPNQ